MSIPILRVAIIGCAISLAACATDSQHYESSGIAESAPVGTHIKNRDGYQRGGSSFSVKVIGRAQINQRQGTTADEILRNN
jgi:hypothetical protein